MDLKHQLIPHWTGGTGRRQELNQGGRRLNRSKEHYARRQIKVQEVLQWSKEKGARSLNKEQGVNRRRNPLPHCSS